MAYGTQYSPPRLDQWPSCLPGYPLPSPAYREHPSREGWPTRGRRKCRCLRAGTCCRQHQPSWDMEALSPNPLGNPHCSRGDALRLTDGQSRLAWVGRLCHDSACLCLLHHAPNSCLLKICPGWPACYKSPVAAVVLVFWSGRLPARPLQLTVSGLRLLRGPGSRPSHGQGQLGARSRLSVLGVSAALRVPGEPGQGTEEAQREGRRREAGGGRGRKEGWKERWKERIMEMEGGKQKAITGHR